jgi:uncharacterized damage-inducible protein DinB
MMKKPSAALAGVLAIVCMGVVSSTLMARQAAAPPAAPAQPASRQAALANDLGTLSDKFVGLARVMAGKYGWRPAQGVRSVGEVFNLIVSENRMLIGLLSETPGQGGTRGGGRGEQPPITEPAEMQEALRTSYATLRQAVAALSDAELQASARMFGRQTTKQGALLMLLFDQHEHLGQSIAYARTKGVTPPWSR